MSRTRHHRNQRHQHIGEDLWSRRAGMGHTSYCTVAKRMTIEKERAEEQALLARAKKRNYEE